MVYTVVRILVIALCCTAAGLSAMHMLQAQRYQLPALRKELKRYGGMLTTEILVAAAAAAVNWYMPILLSMAIQKEQLRENLCNWIMLALFIIAAAAVTFSKSRIPQRKPFGFTRRIARLIACTFILNLLAAILLHVVAISPYIVFAGVDYAVLLAALIMRPIEDRINLGFYKSAQQKIKSVKGLIRIGITGSYGKTETKLILKTILSEKYRVLSTPPSFSTSMGICRVVNEQLKKSHQVFIAEMGAQQKGEIRESARLVRPHYGLITCIGRQHMDSFGSLEAVAQAKFELIQCMQEGGAAFFGSDGSYGDRLYGLCKTRKYRAAVGQDVPACMHAENIKTDERGTRFTLVCEDGEKIRVQSKLLGEFSVRNIALCAAVARKMGMTMQEIAAGIEKIRPIRHHLQLIPGAVCVIDDSENVNPEGAAEALRVLKEFPMRRVVVTAGLYDTDDDDRHNYNLGTQIAEVADFVILIGPEDTREVHRGLKKSGFSESSIRTVRDEYDAAELVQEVIEQHKDTDHPVHAVLYEGIWPEEDEE